MTQCRLFAVTGETEARTLLDLLESVFEEEGHAISAFEDQEKAEKWTIAVYADRDAAPKVLDQLKQASADAGLDCAFQCEELEETDWVSQTLHELAPVRAGRFVLHGSHDRQAAKHGCVALEINAGLAFGTGHHGTTAGCLLALDRLLKSDTYPLVLDLGTGSGVLAIAAAKAHPCQVLATDIDPVATVTARENCRLNRVAGFVTCLTAPGFHHRAFAGTARFDLVIANILAGPLQTMARDMVAATRPGGHIILSGLLPHQKSAIVARYRNQGAVLERSEVHDGWLVLTLRRP